MTVCWQWTKLGTIKSLTFLANPVDYNALWTFLLTDAYFLLNYINVPKGIHVISRNYSKYVT